ncbi:MAG: amidohydrolase family protein [Clostridia bacterium]|nr:amidohydrolase family protein [Clostridia bacterium]
MQAVAGRMLDVETGKTIEDALVAFDEERIVYAGAREGYPLGEDTQVWDAGSGTILPGFIDCHAHLTGEEDAGEFGSGKLFGDQLIGAVHQLGLILQSGFTGIRDMSEAGLYLSRGVERGAIQGPRIVPGGRVMGITSGHVDLAPEMSKAEINAHDHLSYLIDGPDDCVRGVREQFRMGAKFIKICATGGVSSPTDRIDDVQFSPEELRAIVGEAKRHHSYVTAHCTGYEGAYQALLAGVECIEHGVMLTPREVELMAKNDVPLVSTLEISLHVANIPGFPDWMHKKALQCRENSLRSVALCREAGIRIALGTDYSNSKNTSYLTLGREFLAMEEAGMTRLEAVRAGTLYAAQVMRVQDLGVLKEGYLSDIVVCDGDPLESLECISDAKHIRFVAAGGRVVKNLLKEKTDSAVAR